MLRVALTGAECTGKTTLAGELAAHYGTLWVREYARDYVDQQRRALTSADVEPIARGQLAAEEALARAERRIVIQDTDLVSTLVYSRHYYGACPDWIADAARERLANLYLLLHPDVPWIADGLQRDRPETREEIHRLFEGTLRSLGARVVPVRGSWNERRAAAFRAVDELLASRPAPG
jgi:NadR type nicotinamide-nucleotide adenylyltransferase